MLTKKALRWCRFRWLNRLYAGIQGYYWKPCPICGKMFGGHEGYPDLMTSAGGGTTVCSNPDCREKAKIRSLALMDELEKRCIDS